MLTCLQELAISLCFLIYLNEILIKNGIIPSLFKQIIDISLDEPDRL